MAFYDHTATLSGAELALYRIATELNRRDLCVHAILGDRGPLGEHLRAENIHVVEVPFASTLKRRTRHESAWALLDLRLIFSLVKSVVDLALTLRKIKPDVLHTFSAKSNIIGSIAARLANVCQVWQINDRLSSDYMSSTLAAASRLLCRTLPKARVANSWSTLSVSGASGYVIAPGLPMGWPDSAPALVKSNDDCIRIVIVGRLARWKGQDLFLRAAAIAQKKITIPLELHIVGGSLFGEDYMPTLAQLAESLGLARITQFHGQIDDPWTIMARANIVVHSSIIPEPFGQVVIEAMAVGLPVIAPRAGGPSEVIEDGIDGRLIVPNSIEALAEAIEELATDPHLRMTLGTKAKSSARKFEIGNSADQYEAVYATVASRSPSPSRSSKSTAKDF